MKLNERGWGLGVFLGFTLIFVLCVFIAGVNAYKIGLQKEPGIQFGESDKPNVSGKEKYKSLEEKIVASSEKYKNAYYTNLLDGDSVYVPIKTLKENKYLASSENCSGYVRIYHATGENYQYQVYLNCPDYKSEGYIEELDER